MTALETDSTPIKAISEDYARHLPEVLATVRDFVETYEAAWKDVTDWEPVYLSKRDENDHIVRDG